MASAPKGNRQTQDPNEVQPRWEKRTHFTLHLLSGWRVSDSSPLAYLREHTCELDIRAVLHCKDSKGLAYGVAKAGE